MVTRRRNKLRRRYWRSRKQKGGAVNCNEFLKNSNLVQASFGSNYPKLSPNLAVGRLHSVGERETFDRLAATSKFGLMDWYRRKIPGRTEEEWDMLTDIHEVRILGAFFHRFKIVMERLDALRDKLNTPKTFFSDHEQVEKRMLQILGRLHKDKLNTGEYDDQKTDLLNILFKYDPELTQQKKQELTNKIQIIENTLNIVQCILYEIMRIGKLPEGFVMDPRIEEYARNEIIILDRSDYEGMPDFPENRYEFAVKWLHFVDRFNAQINEENPVTFKIEIN